jgi:hypothetical protein
LAVFVIGTLGRVEFTTKDTKAMRSHSSNYTMSPRGGKGPLFPGAVMPAFSGIGRILGKFTAEDAEGAERSRRRRSGAGAAPGRRGSLMYRRRRRYNTVLRGRQRMRPKHVGLDHGYCQRMAGLPPEVE